MTEGAEAPGPPAASYQELATSADTAADGKELSAGRPAGYASDEGTHEPVSGPAHGERKKGAVFAAAAPFTASPAPPEPKASGP